MILRGIQEGFFLFTDKLKPLSNLTDTVQGHFFSK